MNIGNAGQGLAWQARHVEVVDVTRIGIQQVEDIQPNDPVRSDRVPGVGIDERRVLRADAVVLRQRARAEVANAESAVKSVNGSRQVMDGDSAIEGRDQCLGDVVARRLMVGEARMRPRVVRIDRESRDGRVVVGELDPIATRGAAGLILPEVAIPHEL